MEEKKPEENIYEIRTTTDVLFWVILVSGFLITAIAIVCIKVSHMMVI